MLQVIDAVVYCGLAVLPLVMWWRRREAPTAWLAGALTSLGLATLVGLLLPDTTASLTGWREWLTKLGLMLPIILYPYCLLRFAASFSRRRQLSRAAGVATAIVAGTMLAFPYWPGDGVQTWWFTAWTIAFVVQWVGLSVVSAVRLWRAGRSEPTVTRRRMQLLCCAAVGLSAVILLSAVTVSVESTRVEALGTVLVLGAAGCVLVGLAPPAWLRLLWRRTEHGLVNDVQLALISAETRQEVTDAVLPLLTRLLGGGAAVLVDSDGQLSASHGPPSDVDDLLMLLRRAGADSPAGVAEIRLQSGRLAARAGHYAPVFGTDEVRLVRSLAYMVDSALVRIAARDELALAHGRAVEASRLKSEFVANMSHEIRTPINGVIGMTHLLSRTEQSAVQREYTAAIETSADALLTVINDILDFSKIEAGKLDLNANDFDVRTTVEEVVALVAATALTKNIELAMTVARDVPDVVIGDAGRIRQVLLNLAGNAVKFTDAGEVVLRVLRAGARAEDTGQRLRFEVYDTGPGIPAQSIGDLFESFSQADTSSTRRYGGTGLGLAISRRLVELMGGTIGVDSSLGHGSLFWFEVELAPASVGTVPQRPALDALRGHSVLIVDDNATNRTILLDTVREWRLDAVAVASAAEAVTTLTQRHEEGRRFDLALIDYQMPEVDGAELARTMTADPRFSPTARILLTSTGDRGGLSDAEVDSHHTKPVRPSALLETILRVLHEDEHLPRESATRGQPAPFGSTSPAVLVAEDNPISQQVARGMLESLGCYVDVAATGTAVLAATSRHDYQIIFMDCQMPEMDGYQATAGLRAREVNRRTPIVALTAGAMAGDAQRCFDAGMDDFLSKPVRLEDFQGALERWLPAGQNLPSPPPVNLEVLPGLTSGSDRSAGLVDLFLSTTAPQIDAIQEAATAGDSEEVRQLCHAVKGGALYLGATALADRCTSVERTRDLSPSEMLREAEAIAEEFRQVQDFLTARFVAS